MQCKNYVSALISPSPTDKQVRVDLGEVDPPKKPRLEKQENRSSPITVQTSKDLLPNINDYDETNADDFAMEMGLACVVCRYLLKTVFFKVNAYFIWFSN